MKMFSSPRLGYSIERPHRAFAVLTLLCVGGCSVTQPLSTGENRHLQAPAAVASADLPKPVDVPVFLPKPEPARKVELYSVVVFDVPVREVLLALARDARINLDIDPLVKGQITINAVDQSLTQILERIAKQVDVRYTLESGVLTVMQDTPFIKNYSIDYVNLARTANSKVSTSTSIASKAGSGPGAGGDNASSTDITNSADNQFWKTLEKNITEIIASTRRVNNEKKRERDEKEEKDAERRREALIAQKGLQKEESERKRNSQEEKRKDAEIAVKAGAGAGAIMAALTNASPAPQGNTSAASKPAAQEKEISVFVHPESGTLSISATAREHEKVREYLAQVSQGSQRQVLIEATIVEVELGDQYQSGVNWSLIRNRVDGTSLDNSLNSTFNTIGDNLTKLPFTTLVYNKKSSGLLQGADLSATIKLLETFGKAKVLSSPKIMALNNQTAVLKVVDEKVYFELKLNVTPATTTSPRTVEYRSEIKTVPVGVLLSVTPQISESDFVTLNVRPTITRITGYKLDPTFQALQASFLSTDVKVENAIPEIQVRELESVLKLASGQVAILGGLIQDRVDNSRNGLPGLSRLPYGAGDVFSYRNDNAYKTELVIFMRTQVIREPSLNGDLKDFRQYQPTPNFFERPEDEISVFKSGLPAR